MVEGVQALHEFHVWQLAGNKIIASAHIHVHSLQEYMVVAEKIKALFPLHITLEKNWLWTHKNVVHMWSNRLMGSHVFIKQKHANLKQTKI
jgi:hypothetical protein